MQSRQTPDVVLQALHMAVWRRKHVRNGMLSPAQFERQQILKTEGVQKSGGYSVLSLANCHSAELLA